MTLSVETLAEVIKDVIWPATEWDSETACDAVALESSRAHLTAIEQAGYVVVPREASDEMIQNAWQQIDWILGSDPRPEGCTSTFDDVRDAYDAALSAAPKIQHSEGE